jgi:osmoprotectant transport system substrate-binding protein
LHFKGFKTLDDDGVITHTALANGNVQAARIFSSDAVIAQDHFVVLTDPKDFQGAGNLVPVIRTGDATAAVMAVVNRVSAGLTTADLVQFNLAVSASHQDPSSVASQFVSSHNL